MESIKNAYREEVSEITRQCSDRSIQYYQGRGNQLWNPDGNRIVTTRENTARDEEQY